MSAKTTPTIQEQFCRNVRMVREERGWTQAELAHQIGTTRPYVSVIENGRKSPSLSTVARFAAALGVSAFALVMPSEYLPDEIPDLST